MALPSQTQHKLAEKLTILNDRGIGMLTRIYNIKKACGDPKSKPSFLSEKKLESSIKYVIKRFPNIDVKGLQPITDIRTDIIKSLSLYYHTFVDLLDFRDHVSELLTTMDACQVHLDINLNYDLTKNYLDLVVTYVTLMIILSRVEDRKAVLGLFNAAHEMSNNQSDASFPRLGQMILEYDPPLKKLAEEFVPHSKLLISALMSVRDSYSFKSEPADEWRRKQFISLLSAPAQMLTPARNEMIKSIQCEYLSVEVMERWLIFGFSLCHQFLKQPTALEMWTSALHQNWVLTLFRDEVWSPHIELMSFFEGMKGNNKRISDIKECASFAMTVAPKLHKDKRNFLRSILKELSFIFADQPGLLGPKVLYVFIALSLARDEVLWLLRHGENPPPKTFKSKSMEDLVDRLIPELMFYMEELRGLVRKYNQVIQRYYVQYLCGYDAVALSQIMQDLHDCPEDDCVILSSVSNNISKLSIKQVEMNELFDFRGLRLDWFRLQAYTSGAKSQLLLPKHPELASLLNSVVFHTKMVDFLDEMLVECSDLSMFCFYSKTFEDNFNMCLEFPAQNRYIIAFPLICGHFQNCTNELCPEERHHIRERSLSVVSMFLEDMAKEAKNIITTICDEQCVMSDKLLAKHCAQVIVDQVTKHKRDKNKKNLYEDRPGMESYRKTRENLTTMDKLHMALTELCYAINYCPTITVWEYVFAPREYLHQHLENRFAKSLVGMVMYNPESKVIAKPSELLNSVHAYMHVLQSVENYVHIDITRVFNNVLLQQTQQTDSHGEKTIAALYTQWYADTLLRRVSGGHIVYSPSQHSFVTLSYESSQLFVAEDYSDITELRALAELIGPYGIKLINETLMWHIASQILELKKLVKIPINRETLIGLRTHFDKPETMKELSKRLMNVDDLLQRMTIIGVILCFRQLAQNALGDALGDRIPFLVSSINDFRHNVTNGDSMLVTEMCSAAGLPCKVDPALLSVLRQQKLETTEDDDYLISCLLMVFVAVSIPKLAKMEGSQFRPALEAHTNNIHCLGAAVNHIFGALFTLHGENDIEARLKEFLALASSSLLRLGQETDKELIRNRESVYLLLDEIVKESPFLTMDLLESCFPYALIRNSYHAVYRTEMELN